MNNKLIALIFGLVLIAGVVPTVSAQQMIIKTTMPKTTVVADGRTEYRMDVWADTT